MNFKKQWRFFILYSLFFYFARKTLKDIYKHTYSLIHKIIHIFTVNMSKYGMRVNIKSIGVEKQDD